MKLAESVEGAHLKSRRSRFRVGKFSVTSLLSVVNAFLSPLSNTSSPASRSHNLVGRILHRVANREVHPRVHQDLLTFVHVRSLEPQYNRQLDIRLPRSFHHASRQRIDAQDPAKNVNQHRL